LHETNWQVPEAQDAMAFGSEQGTPQAPQFDSVSIDVSHPLAVTPSQLAHPGLQDAIWQVPVEHVEVALAREHTTPQPPQLLSVSIEVSQPLSGLPSQSAQPGAQVGTQAPLLQMVVPCALVQLIPQAPQFIGEFKEVSQPLA
jgi:hypothetical protein